MMMKYQLSIMAQSKVAVNTVKQTKQHGFTLIEVIIAVFIFGIVMSAAYVGFGSFMSLSKSTQESIKRQQAIISAMAYLENDFRYMIDRNTRNDYGDVEAAFNLDNLANAQEAVALTTMRPDFLYEDMALPQRVVWLVKDERLIRKYWYVVDRVAQSEFAQIGFLRDVKAFSVTEKTANAQANNFAPPAAAGAANARQLPGGKKLADIPDAIEVNIEFTDGAKLSRIIEVVSSNRR